MQFVRLSNTETLVNLKYIKMITPQFIVVANTESLSRTSPYELDNLAPEDRCKIVDRRMAITTDDYDVLCKALVILNP